MALSNADLASRLKAALGERIGKLFEQHGELTINVKAEQLLDAAVIMRDAPDLRFTILIDLCGVDYSDYGAGVWEGPRFAVVCHLLSIEHNIRLRVKAFAPD